MPSPRAPLRTLCAAVMAAGIILEGLTPDDVATKAKTLAAGIAVMVILWLSTKEV